jgi:hypothetical protein
MLCTITGTVDWDRFHNGNTMFIAGWSVRLLDIDPREPFNVSTTASEQLKDIVGDKRLICQVEARKGINLRAKCFTSAPKLEDRVDVGAEMVRRGFAFDCESYSHGEYRELEVSEARAMRPPRPHCNASNPKAEKPFEPEPILSDPRLPVSTRNADYSIVRGAAFQVCRSSPSPGECRALYDDSSSWCVYRNEEELFCGRDADRAGLGTPIKAKNYVLIPVSATSGGSGGHWGDYYLLIEKRNGATVEKLIEGCNAAACDVGTDRVNYRANEVDFHVGRSEGYLVTAHFRDGALSVSKQKIDPQKPWDNESCNRLLWMVGFCSFGRPSCDLYSGHQGRDLAVIGGYPVAKNIYEQECKNVCTSGKFDPKKFVRKFCHRRWGSWVKDP